MTEEKSIGKISHYYDKIGVGIIELAGGLKTGDTIKVKGKDTDFEQVIDSMQIEHAQVEKAKKGDVIGVKMNQKVKEGDEVYLK
ncbi:MAG: putative protease [Parcubacteria group bacterium Gr01-1014_2]|nr:MAG: putative protease [Parcubacteria group bacterium Gr01-1014_2]